MIAGMEMMSCPNLSVPAEVMQHIVNVESGKNPYAIGVVGGQLVRQPQNMDEAIVTAQMLESKGYNYSLGIAQVNRNNLGKYGLDSYEKAFSVCSNLAAGSQILAECYNSSGGDWGKAFSCYYSGNFVTGYRTGYVQKVFDSINRTAMLASNTERVTPIQLAGEQPVNPRVTPLPTAAPAARVQVPATANGAAYRLAIRSSLIDTALNTLVSPAVASAADIDPAAAQAAAQLQGTSQAPNQAQAQAPGTPGNGLQRMMQQVQQANYPNQPQPAAPISSMQQMMQQVQQANYGPAQAQAPANQPIAPSVSQQQAPTMATAAGTVSPDDVFEPQVRGPNDPVQSQPQAAAQPMAAGQQAAPAADQADLRQGNSDGAFVF
nr:lytic transglycosylase domain-containing protein [Dyella sp. GSA-30]